MLIRPKAKILKKFFILGDGTFSELFNGIIFRNMLAQSGNNENNFDYENIPYPEIPCGKIKK